MCVYVRERAVGEGKREEERGRERERERGRDRGTEGQRENVCTI